MADLAQLLEAAKNTPKKRCKYGRILDALSEELVGEIEKMDPTNASRLLTEADDTPSVSDNVIRTHRRAGHECG